MASTICSCLAWPLAIGVVGVASADARRVAVEAYRFGPLPEALERQRFGLPDREPPRVLLA